MIVGNVLVISDGINGFFANSVCNELTKRRINIYKAGLDDDRINDYLVGSSLIFLILSDEFDVNSIFFSSVKKKCRESTKKIVAYGSADKIDDIKRAFPADKFADTFIRPMDNAVMVAKIAIILEEIEESYNNTSADAGEENGQLEQANSDGNSEKAEENSEENNEVNNEEKTEDNNEETTTEAKSEEPEIPVEKKNILVVDDSGQMLRTILGWLEGKYNVRLANSAETAAVSINKDIPDLILLDYEMPEVSGPEFFVQLREKERTKDIPVIFLTAQNDADSVRAVLELRPQGYILKTTASTTLVEKLDDFFRKQNK